MMPDEQGGEPGDKPQGHQDGPSRGALIALLVIVALVAGGIWLSQRIGAASHIQDCVMAGRTNCAPVTP